MLSPLSSTCPKCGSLKTELAGMPSFHAWYKCITCGHEWQRRKIPFRNRAHPNEPGVVVK